MHLAVAIGSLKRFEMFLHLWVLVEVEMVSSWRSLNAAHSPHVFSVHFSSMHVSYEAHGFVSFGFLEMVSFWSLCMSFPCFVHTVFMAWRSISVSFVSLSLKCTQYQCNATMAFGFKLMQVGFFSVWRWTLMQWVCVVSLEKVESFKYGMKDQDSSCRKKTDSCILRKSRRLWTLFPHTRACLHLGPMPLTLATKHLAFGILSPSFPCKSRKYDQNCQNCH